MFGILIIFEIIISVLIAYGFYHEKQVIEFEQKLINKIKNKIGRR